MNSKSILAGAALVFAATAHANPEIVPFVGDEETRIRPDRVYTHALDFGKKWNDPWVNGVQFKSTGQDGANDAGYSWDGFPESDFDFQDGSPLISTPHSETGIYQVLGDFNFGKASGSAWLRGLTPGIVYETRFYHRPFSSGDRWQTFTFKPGGGAEDAKRFNPDGQLEDQMLIYRFEAVNADLEIVFDSSENPEDTYHCYGLVNEQVYEVAPEGGGGTLLM